MVSNKLSNIMTTKEYNSSSCLLILIHKKIQKKKVERLNKKVKESPPFCTLLTIPASYKKKKQ